MARWDGIKNWKFKDFLITEVGWKNDSEVVITSADGRKISLDLEADCCSYSYFDKESVEVLNGLMGHKLCMLEEVATDAPVRECSQEDQSVHALKITTDKTSDTVLWRNDSNGYYDGYLNVRLA